MSYREKPQLKLYKFQDNAFILQAIIDDYQEVSFERNLYQAGVFSISINFNIPNSQLFQRGLFVQFGSDPYDFGEIITIKDQIGEAGKGSQLRTIMGYDSRYIFKRRVIKNMNSNGLWTMTAKGELCLRNLINDQCGEGAEEKRKLPIANVIPDSSAAIGKEYSVSEQFTNLYEVCKTIATQSEIGWRLKFNGTSLSLECYEGEDRSQNVQFSPSFDSLANGNFQDSSESFSNAIYVGGKGQNDDRDIYEGEDGTPSGLNRFESWDNQSSMTSEDEYEAEALSMLTQYGQTIQMSGNGLAKCPYEYKNQYNVGDWITISFNNKSAIVQILSVTEHWLFGSYNIQFSFGKPQNNIQDQLQLMLRKIQSASNKTNSTDSVRWYTIPTDTEMPKADVTYNTIGFIGECAENGSTFKLYWDSEKTGAKTYHVYFKQLAGGKLTLTTGVSGATNLILNSGTYVAIIYVDSDGNVNSQGATATNVIESGNTQPATSGGVADAISSAIGTNPDVSNATGVLPIAHGGTGKTTAKDACNELINGLSTGDSVPVDDDYAITQYVNGGTTTKTYHRRKMIRIWEYIKGKIENATFSLFNATTIRANGYQLKRYYEIDLSSLSTSNFYPVTFASTDLELDCEIHSPNLGGSASYNQNLIHFLLIAQGWSDTPKRFVVLAYGRFQSDETTIGCIAYGNQDGVNCVWLRGGMLYRFYCNRQPTLHTSDYSNGNEKFTVGTNYYGGSNSNLTVIWTPGNYQSFYTSNNIQAFNFYGNLIGTANKIRTSAPSSPSNGDIWIS